MDSFSRTWRGEGAACRGGGRVRSGGSCVEVSRGSSVVNCCGNGAQDGASGSASDDGMLTARRPPFSRVGAGGAACGGGSGKLRSNRCSPWLELHTSASDRPAMAVSAGGLGYENPRRSRKRQRRVAASRVSDAPRGPAQKRHQGLGDGAATTRPHVSDAPGRAQSAFKAWATEPRPPRPRADYRRAVPPMYPGPPLPNATTPPSAACVMGRAGAPVGRAARPWR